MKVLKESNTNKYSNEVIYTKNGTFGSGPIYWENVRGDRIVKLLSDFSEILNNSTEIQSWNIIANGGDVNIKFETVAGKDYPHWSFKYSSLSSDNSKNLARLKKGLASFLH